MSYADPSTDPSGRRHPGYQSPGTPPRHLRRRTDLGKVGGVCAGIADYVGIDVTIVRLVAVLLLFAGPGGPAYLVAWAVIPDADPGEPLASPRATRGQSGLAERGPQLVGVGLLAIALLVLWDSWDWPAGRFLAPLALIGLGIALLTRGASPEPGSAGPWEAGPPPPPAGPPPSAWPTPPPPPPASDDDDVTAALGIDAPPPGDEVTATHVFGPPPPVEGSYPSPPVEEPPPAGRRRSPASLVAGGAALAWAGLAILLGLDPQLSLAVGLAILGAGMVAGGLLGGGRALILPAVVVAAALVGIATLDVPLGSGVGDRSWAVADVTEVRGPYRLTAGEGHLDLRALEVGRGETVAVEASVAMGKLVVRLPDGVGVRIDASATAGSVRVLGRPQQSGLNVDLVHEEEPALPHLGTVALDLEVGFGEVEVRR